METNEHHFETPVVHEIYVPKEILDRDTFNDCVEYEEPNGCIIQFAKKLVDNVVDLNEYRAKLPMYRRPPNL